MLFPFLLVSLVSPVISRAWSTSSQAAQLAEEYAGEFAFVTVGELKFVKAATGK
jgi:hypothetical protein